MATCNRAPDAVGNLRVQISVYCAFILTCTAFLALFNAPVSAADRMASGNEHRSAERAATAVLDEFMLAFNNQDMDAWSKTLNYPHVRFASGSVRVWQDAREFQADRPFAALAQAKWDHSHWRSRKVVMSSPAKVHIATVFERFNAANQSIGVYESLYIVTRVNGKWGIQARSSLAP